MENEVDYDNSQELKTTYGRLYYFLPRNSWNWMYTSQEYPCSVSYR